MAPRVWTVSALIDAFGDLPEVMRRSPTWDRRNEMVRYAEFTDATGVPVFFCDAYCPWERSSNENTNGLIRLYLPKKTDLSRRSHTTGRDRRGGQRPTSHDVPCRGKLRERSSKRKRCDGHLNAPSHLLSFNRQRHRALGIDEPREEQPFQDPEVQEVQQHAVTDTAGQQSAESSS